PSVASSCHVGVPCPVVIPMVQFCLTLSVDEGTRFRFLWGYRNFSERGMKVPCLPFLRGVIFASYESPVASPLPVRSGWFSSYNRRIRTQAPVAHAPGSLRHNQFWMVTSKCKL